MAGTRYASVLPVRAGLDEQHAAVFERAGDRVGHLRAARAALERGQRSGERSRVGEDVGDRGRLRLRRSGVQREHPAQLLDFRFHHAERGIVVRRGQRARDELADLVHLALAHAARRDRRRADADAARRHRRVRIERDRVLVDRDAGLAERRFGDLAGEAAREHVDQHQMVVGAAADEPEPAADEHRREPLGVGDDLLLIVANAGSAASLKHTALAAMTCISGPPWMPGKTRFVEILRVLLAAQHHARRADRAASCASSS